MQLYDGSNNDPGSFTVSGNGSVSGSGVSIILTSTTPSTTNSWGAVNISGGSPINITAPDSGQMQGVAFYFDRNAPLDNSNDFPNNFSGGSTQNITGSFYFQTQNVNFLGGSSNGAACTQLIACQAQFSGGSGLGDSSCPINVPGLQTGLNGVPAE